MSEGVKKTLANLDAGLILVLLLLTFAVSPLLRSGLPSMADVPIHLYRLVELDRCWQDGVYHPRWAPTLAFGYGYPLFNFAPPLPYFIAELFHVLGADFETAIRLLAVLCFLLYGLGMYLFAREVLGAKPALLAAAAYVYTPFRFREALIYGGNYPQILAMALYPWILWAFHRIIVEDRPKYIVAGALSYAGLMLSHNFHALVFTPLLLAYAVHLMWTTKKWSRAREAGLALALGLGLSAFFWVPVLHDMRWTPARADFYISHTDFHQRFLSPRDLVAWPMPLDASADNPYLPFSLGPTIVVLAVVSLAALAVDAGYQVWKRWIRRSRPVACPVADSSFRPSTRSGRSPLRSDGALRLFASDSSADTFVKWHLLFFALVLAASVFMILPASAPIWENVPFLPIGEFPWRLMGIANLASAFLAGASLCFWSARWSDRGAISKALLALMASLVIVVLSVAVYFYPTKPFIEYDNPSLQDYFRYELSTQTMGTTVIGEYMPVWARQTPTTSPLMPAYLAGQPVEKLNREDLPGSVQAQLVEHTVVSDRYRFTSDQPFTAHFYTFYFTAWRAYLDGQPTEIQITDPFALIAVPVPAGEHELLLRFENLPLWTAMNTLSAIALLAVLAIWVLYRGRRARLGYPAPDGAFSRNQALLLGGVLLLLFLVKVLLVDPHTTWFRRRSPVGQVIGVQHPARVNLDDKILFLGYDLISGDTVRQGEDLHVRLYWLALQPLDVNYSSFLHLDAPPDYVTWATSDNLHPGDPQALTDVPSSNWWTSTYVRDEHRLEVPSDIPPVQYLRRVGLYDQGTGERLMVLADDGSVIGDSITLQPVRVIRAKPVSLRRLPYRVEYTLGAQIELLGYDVAIENWELGIGDLELTLYWRAKAVVENDYTVFVHLVDQGGKLWGQGDSIPVRGMYLTSAWLPGQLVEDRHVIQVDPGIPPGSYRVLVGLYDPATLERLEAVGPEGPVLSEAEGPPSEGAITLTKLRIGN
jgi:4-amino-4-deoxy-L-arabinose transferase-like glycosyltransferase